MNNFPVNFMGTDDLIKLYTQLPIVHHKIHTEGTNGLDMYMCSSNL